MEANRRPETLGQSTHIAVVGPLDYAQRVDIHKRHSLVTFSEHVWDLPTSELGSYRALAAPPLEVTPSVLALMPNLTWIHIWSAGADEALSPELLASSAVLTCAKGNGAVPLAEHAVLLLLMLNRDASRWIRAQDERRWERYTHGELNGATCVIIGTGSSGADLAHKLKAFHMKTIGVRRRQDPVAGFDEIVGQGELAGVLPEADYVIVMVPSTPDTVGMIDARMLGKMRPTASIIVLSRGGIVDDVALRDALMTGVIAGAALDAHVVEPLPRESHYWSLPNTIITPHNGATTKPTWTRGVDIFLANLGQFQRGESLHNVVDKTQGY